MSQNPLVDSGTPFSKTTGLKPPLAAALTSLEVHLDQELARYRRTRIGYRTFNQSRVGFSKHNKFHQLAVIHKTGGNTQLPVEDSLQKFGLTTPTSTPNTLEQEESLPETKINTPKAVVSIQNKVSASTTAPDTLLQPQETPTSTQQPQHNDSKPSNATGQTQSLISIVPVGVNEQTHTPSENLAENQPKKQPDDYLESSEALLRSLAEEEPKTHKPSNSNDSLLSPLGIGSMLLLLLASLTLGYVLFNPKSLSQFSLGGLLKYAPTTADQLSESSANVKNVAQPEITPIPKYPNLATDEFPEVRDPNDVVSLKPKPKPTLTASPNPATVQNPTNPITIPNVQPPVGLSSTPSPKINTPQKPSNTQQKLDTQIKPSADGLYHVITDNKGDRSFVSARQVVPDAYLSPDGKVIYLGALTTKEKAQTLLQQLQEKGIKARIE
jgi:hypothetical protein